MCLLIQYLNNRKTPLGYQLKYTLFPKDLKYEHVA